MLARKRKMLIANWDAGPVWGAWSHTFGRKVKIMQLTYKEIRMKHENCFKIKYYKVNKTFIIWFLGQNVLLYRNVPIASDEQHINCIEINMPNPQSLPSDPPFSELWILLFAYFLQYKRNTLHHHFINLFLFMDSTAISW